MPERETEADETSALNEQTNNPETAQPMQEAEAAEQTPGSQTEAHVYGSYSSYDSYAAQQPYNGGYRPQQGVAPNDGYKSPYGAQQSYTPNAPQNYGSAYTPPTQYQQSYYQYPPTVQPQPTSKPPKKTAQAR